MLSLSCSSGRCSERPEFDEDYQLLWDKYTEDEMTSAWKKMCQILSGHSYNCDMLGKFQYKGEEAKAPDAVKYEYTVPLACSKSVSKIIESLKEYKVLEEGSKISEYTTGSCRVIIMDRYGYETQYNRMFSQVNKLMQPDSITIVHQPWDNGGSQNLVRFNDLTVSDVSIESSGKVRLFGSEQRNIIELLKFLSDNHYITISEIQQNRFSFAYGSNQIGENLQKKLVIFTCLCYNNLNPKFVTKEVDFLLTTELEERLENTEVFNAEMIEDNAPPELADVLSKYMNEEQISKTDIIRMLNVDRNYGYQMLNGTRIPTRNCLIQIALILKLDADQISYLLRLSGKPPLYVRNIVDARVFYAVKHNMEYHEAIDFIWGSRIM